MIPYIKGVVTPQAHVDIPEGTFEEEFARNGFSGRYAHLYRTDPPVEWLSIDGPLRPQLFDLNVAQDAGDDFLRNRRPFLENDDVRILFFIQTREMSYYFRNADADELFFIHEGTGVLETDFGQLQYEEGDYLIIPRGTTYRVVPTAQNPTKVLLVESFSEIRLPDKGMLGQHALFDPAVLKTPEPTAKKSVPGRYQVKVQRCGEITTVTYPFCPLNAVGWKGTLTVWQLNVRDIRPILSDRYHLPPSAHSTFVAHNFVVCTFLPRPLENGDPKAMKVPFYHSNIDFDEVLFYHRGQFFSRSGIVPGMMTFHPQGIHHGPQAAAINRAAGKKTTDEIAVMIDTKRPLRVAPGADAAEVKEYWRSWIEKAGEA